MQSLGTIPEERLQYIPEIYWKKHEFCFFLHDQILTMLTQYETSGIHNKVAHSFAEAIKGREDELQDFDMLEFLKVNKLDDLYQHHILSHVILALTADMLHFLYEALTCFEKRKFIVGFSLLRKPLKENLLFLSWLLADEADFITRFEKDNYKTLNSVDKEKRIEIYEKAISKLATAEAFDANLIWQMIHSKNAHGSLEPSLQRATHLITSMGNLLKTSDYSFNLIFENPADDYYYDFLYEKLPYLFTFMAQVSLEAFNRIHAVNDKTYGHLAITMIGAYQALFSDRKSQNISRILAKELKEFLKCINCEKPLKISKKNAPNLYIAEQIECTHCGTISQFPLYWLMSLANLNVIRDRKPSTEK